MFVSVSISLSSFLLFEIAFVVRFIRSCSVFKDLLTLLESYIIILQLNLFVNIYFNFFIFFNKS